MNNNKESTQLLVENILKFLEQNADTSRQEILIKKEKYFSFANEMQKEYKRAYENEDFEMIQYYNRVLRKFINQNHQKARKDETSFYYEQGLFNGTFYAFSQMLSDISEQYIFNIEMSKVIEYKYVSETLKYLYEHECSRNKDICQTIGVEPNNFKRITKLLEDTEAITRKTNGKAVFYKLTKPAKRYVSEVLGYKGNEIIDNYGFLFLQSKAGSMILSDVDDSYYVDEEKCKILRGDIVYE